MMQGKGKQFVGPGRTVRMAFPGGGGYGDPADRDKAAVARDLANGYITAETAASVYGLNKTEISDILDRAAKGERF